MTPDITHPVVGTHGLSNGSGPFTRRLERFLRGM